MFRTILLATTACLSAAPAMAGAPVPVPLAGLAGPYGLIAAGAAYGGYRLVKYLRQQS
jgi:hypothetical protein